MLEFNFILYLNKNLNERRISFDEALGLLKDITENGVPLKKDIMVVRRERGQRFMSPDENGNYKNDAMLSTSINYCGKSRKFGDYISFIELKKGTKILYLEQFTQFEKQYEIVLPPDCEFKYIGKNKGDEYIWECVKY